MHKIEGKTLLSPSDLIGLLACEHLTQLELAVTRGELVRPVLEDAELDLLARKGHAHELEHLERLRTERRHVVAIADHPETLDGLRAAEEETLAAMRAGADVIYQAAFFDGTWRGRADYLLRVETASNLGVWSYEVADAKLARSVKVNALLQMCDYSLHVARLQGLTPESMHVILGDRTQESHRVAEYDAYHRAARARLEERVLGAPVATYPEPVDHCRVCRWRERCGAQWRADDHLSLVAGMRRDHARRLVDAGISTVARLAEAAEEPVADVGDAPWERLRQQARLQLEERTTGRQTFDVVLCEEPGLGLAALPPPSAGDLFFDMEGDPFVVDGGLEYLFGIIEVVDGAPRFHAFWGHDATEEKAAFEALVDLIIDRLTRDPDLHVYHYANYEVAALKKLMGRHATREEEVDRLLRGGAFVDLYRVVRQGVRVSKESYGLKSLEAYYMPKREETIADAAGSIVAYERWLEIRDPALLDDIGEYNQRDCESTRLLRSWLEDRRHELAARTGVPVPRPEPREGEAPQKVAQAAEETRELVEALSAGVGEDAASRTADEQARWLLAQLLEWHRREEKSGWWAYYERCDHMTDQDLVEDSESIGDITHLKMLRTEDKSVVHQYAFNPLQEHKFDVGDEPHDPRTKAVCGEIVALDNDQGIVELRRGPRVSERGHPTSLIPGTPYNTRPMRDALRRLATWAIANGPDAPGEYRAVRDLLLRRPPRLRGGVDGGSLVAPGEDPVLAARRLVMALDDTCLAVQGPPGCGKTYTGAQMIVELVRRGCRVGVCATTHRAIGNLLEEMCKVAAERGVSVRAIQKCEAEEGCEAPGIRRAGHASEVEEALQAGEVDVVAGTSWLLADQRFDGRLDVIIIDEAGQMSLANACAVGTAGRNLVLLGDPQQLAQPSQGIHPKGAERSALEHVLAGHDTIPADRGMFLPTTRRMHPEVCAFVSAAFYEDRLTALAECARQRVNGADGGLSGSGTRLAQVEHRGNRTWSPEEVAAVAGLVEQLHTATWTDADGVEHPLGLSDVLVVAPYNAQVKRLRERLPDGARVGTVDKFQGQEGAVTIYAMATSSAEDIPRNLEFLFSRNRLNVAVSRARALVIVVCSPELLRVRCRTPEQLRLVNALCRFAEMATPIGTAGELVASAPPALR
ncbi:MAG: TM0106 family RecB-like putative nuclease [Chloroflexi bacterium]|nr:MAG: TM0106 family RecB-like putative nuclease [Chloroflexota bacterium]